MPAAVTATGQAGKSGLRQIELGPDLAMIRQTEYLPEHLGILS
jgi:hypothetical protein